MKVAVIYNLESQAVINHFGRPCQEQYSQETINDIKNSLAKGGHQVFAFEGDKHIIEKLEHFMTPAISGQISGMVFNLCYGIQGKGRYMHIPGVLEMMGIPYVGSAPDTHALAMNKVVTKIIIEKKGLPTPKFTVMERSDSDMRADMQYPLIVKPKDETSSLGLRKVTNEAQLRKGVKAIFDAFTTQTLVEEYIDGREINVGLLGNNPVVALPPVELLFKEDPRIFTFEDKYNISGRKVDKICPALLSKDETVKIQQLAIDTYNAVGCLDFARVDIRLDKEGNPYVLEINSMPGLNRDSSLVIAAKNKGLDFTAFINRLVEVAHERYIDQVITLSDD
ncbi:MAG: D-alanine--D-alanine ligase domain protein [Clostridiales bacterium 38_11]|nr:MAG: D-alanine--D-alanine ligase domain protein [Clostridiales bacterium 38_11]HBH11953.1 hypothetical protein [Clostridiales bacterium]